MTLCFIAKPKMIDYIVRKWGKPTENVKYNNEWTMNIAEPGWESLTYSPIYAEETLPVIKSDGKKHKDFGSDSTVFLI